jgi:hypothetical protein
VPLAPSQSIGEDMDSEGVSEAQSIQDLFGGNLSEGWGVIYRPTKAFLCHNWVHRRLFTGKDALKPGKWTFAGEHLGDLTDFDIDSYSAYLKRRFNLVKCGMDDDDRVSFEQPSGALPI